MSRGLTVDDAFRVQYGLVYDLGSPDEACTVFKSSQTGWYYGNGSADELARVG